MRTRQMIVEELKGTRSFQGVDLRDCDLSTLNLSGVDFRGCDLRGADFSFADIRGAIFINAVISSQTTWKGVQMSGEELEGIRILPHLNIASILEPVDVN